MSIESRIQDFYKQYSDDTRNIRDSQGFNNTLMLAVKDYHDLQAKSKQDSEEFEDYYFSIVKALMQSAVTMHDEYAPIRSITVQTARQSVRYLIDYCIENKVSNCEIKSLIEDHGKWVYEQTPKPKRLISYTSLLIEMAKLLKTT